MQQQQVTTTTAFSSEKASRQNINTDHDDSNSATFRRTHKKNPHSVHWLFKSSQSKLSGENSTSSSGTVMGPGLSTLRSVSEKNMREQVKENNKRNETAVEERPQTDREEAVLHERAADAPHAAQEGQRGFVVASQQHLQRQQQVGDELPRRRRSCGDRRCIPNCVAVLEFRVEH